MTSRPPKPKRRKFVNADKARIVDEYDKATTALERAIIMRREGVYASLIAAWRKQCSNALAEPGATLPRKRGRPPAPPVSENEQLKREILALRTRAERAEDLVETLGKVYAFLQNAVSKNV